MKILGWEYPKRKLIKDILWCITFVLISKESAPYSPINTQGLLGTIAWMFMLVGIYRFYSGLFRFYDWYNNK
ncbi:hypothetical protein PRCB_10205 [Pantoea rodasii]|uniref:Uncharacterized protein n=1 Tax=Pantoea rodasii TaxID=1076549 RepID=A0A2M9WDV9_9GAMM|nr:hypothetical protein HA45_14240 [Pantoea rodasii]PJZ05740.1 hypothetical protein PRCB_10205 [Pantoea rodasii]